MQLKKKREDKRLKNRSFSYFLIEKSKKYWFPETTGLSYQIILSVQLLYEQ